MIKNNSFQEIWARLKKSKKVLLTLHYAPDGDSLGSCIALKYVLERDFKCQVTLISKDNLDETLMDMPYSKEIKFGVDISTLDLNNYDTTVFLDSGMMIRMFKEKYSLPKNIFIINIDHHGTNDYVAPMNYIDAETPSTCSLLMQMFKSVGVKFDKELSTRLLLGLCTDTGFFMHNSNVAITEASFLIGNGADYQFIVSSILKRVPLKLKKYYALLIDRFKIIKINNINVGYSYVDAKDIKRLALNTSEVRLGINWLLDIRECDIVFTLSDLKDNIKGSFRSRGDIDVSRLAVMLNGGGHKAAAAFVFESMSLKDAEKKVLSLLKKNL
jgi:bifunctional oligoribonuclease and PAP phosphatase NrnA